MATQHKNLTGDDLHEPKGCENANANEVYVADGSGSGSWTSISALVASTKVVTTVSGLSSAYPSPSTGDRAIVTDANATTFNSTVAGGGSNIVPVFYAGGWKIG